jgi:hypothetical protein
MATSLAYTAEYPHPAAAVRAALLDEQYWKDRTVEVGGPQASVDSFLVDGEVLRVELTQHIASSDLPNAITAALPHGLVIRRTETYAGDGGAFDAVVDGAPARISGAVTLTDAQTGATAVIEGTVEVSVPLYGKKIETTVAANLIDLLAAEAEFTNRWIAASAEQ